ncbi:pyridoxamine 5'-phosphate oxidase family protein [Candidatus Roizmanbacteria bacterium]|nr:pyridoxamine 5'-phosphate oxidase family protein [Candidatus Roizmanbacteria bacterium]
MEKKLKSVVNIIKKIEYLNIASITPDDHPWNSPVYTAYDKNLNFYWLSWRNNQHSINVRNNPNVFVTIYDSTAPAGTGVGVYFSGQAKELTNAKDMVIALTVVYKRSKHKMRAIAEFLKHFPRRVYRFTPEKVWINGDSDIKGNFIDIRTELKINELKKNL